MHIIQRTTVSERRDEKARIDIQISDKDDLEKSKQSVVLSVLIDCGDASYRLEWLQSKALTIASSLIGEAADKCDNAVARTER